jgi:hypothetical protein
MGRSRHTRRTMSILAVSKEGLRIELGKAEN